MAEVTVRQLADVIGISVDRLLVRLDESGLPHRDPGELINEDDKNKLLLHLRRIHGKNSGEKPLHKKVTLKRKSVSEIKIPATQTRLGGQRRLITRSPAKTVTVEVRKRRTYQPETVPKTNKIIKTDAGEFAARSRMEAAKRALQVEAKQRHQEIEAKLRVEREEREHEEIRRKIDEERTVREKQEAKREQTDRIPDSAVVPGLDVELGIDAPQPVTPPEPDPVAVEPHKVIQPSTLQREEWSQTQSLN